jgi:threonine/homoserine/homoserine lactone efflux protein
MDINLFFTFFVISFSLIIIPGPNVLVIVSTSITHGKNRGLQTVAGTSIAMAIQLVIVGVGTAWFIQILSEGFYFLKWLGVAYLLYLGFFHIKCTFFSESTKYKLTAASSFSRGFFVSLTNPKTLLFFSAFLPQFISSTEHYLQQITLLSITFLLLAVVLDSCYALLSSRLQPILEQRNLEKIQNGFSGLLFLGASVWLATSRLTDK